MHLQISRNTRARGFSLVELMTVVAIVAILGTIAVSSYRAYTLRATRTEGRLALLAIQVGQEKFFLQNNQYAQNIPTVIAAVPMTFNYNNLDQLATQARLAKRPFVHDIAQLSSDDHLSQKIHMFMFVIHVY